MCSDEHDQGVALVKMGLRLKAAFHGGYAQSSEMWRFWPEGTKISQTPVRKTDDASQNPTSRTRTKFRA
jgi:hypothetical protein